MFQANFQRRAVQRRDDQPRQLLESAGRPRHYQWHRHGQLLGHGPGGQAALTLPGPNNDLILTANQSGTAFNGVSVNIVNGGNMGNTAQAAYDASTKTLTLTIDGSNQTSTDAP